MLKPNIHRLESAISGILAGGFSPGSEELSAGRRRAVDEISALQTQLIAGLFGTAKETALTRWLRYHQAAITSLSDRLSSFDDSQSAAANPQTINDLCSRLEQLLKMLEQSFSILFDQDQPTSLFRAKLLHQSIAAKTSDLESNEGLSTDTKTLVLSVGHAFRTLSSRLLTARGTYRQWDSLDRYLNEMQAYISERQPGAEELFFYLYRENFNADELSSWYQERLLGVLSGLPQEALAGRLDAEVSRLFISGLPPKTGVDERRPAIADSLQRWISQLQPQLAGSHAVREVTIGKMPLELSVAQLGFFLRLCYVTGCFHNNNITAMLRFFSGSFTSKKQEHISQKSLARTFYGADQGTAATCRAWLQKMIDHINKKYFPR